MTRNIPAEQCAIAGANIRALRQRPSATSALTRQARPGHAAVSR